MKHQHNISENLSLYLQSWYCTSTTKKMVNGARIELTYDQFVGLFQKRQLDSLQRAIDEHRLQGQQSRDSDFAYVLTWQSYNARSSNVFSVDTACVCSRQKSKALSIAKTGDKLRAEHVAACVAGITGLPKTEEHCANISKAKAGVPIAGWSPERKAARALQRQAQQAAKRAAGANQ